MTKWGGRPHWEFAGAYLGADGHGDWVGFTAGTRFSRPGAEFVAAHDHVTLVPAAGAFLATYWPDRTAEGDVRVYVDVTTLPRWVGSTLHAVDLDLDVVRRDDGTVFVDDEDEFAEQRVAFGYPPEVVSGALQTCATLLAAVRRRTEPFDEATPASWLTVLRSLPAR